MLTNVVKCCTRLLLKLYGMKIKGTENIPLNTGEGLLVACNHISAFDPPAVYVTMEHIREARIMAKKELFENRFVRKCLTDVKSIPVDRHKEGGDFTSVKTVLKALKNGECVVMFPEGTRSKDGKPLPAKTGIAVIADRAKVPVLPVKIEGTFGFPFVGRKMKLTFGKNLLRFEGFPFKDPKYKHEEFAAAIMNEINKLNGGHAA